MDITKKLRNGALLAGAGLILSIPSNVNAAEINPENHKSVKSEEYEYDSQACAGALVGNSLLQGVIAGIGGLQNGSSFWRSFYQGAIGGAFVGAGKCMVAQDSNNAWSAKLTNALGSSIVYNVSNGDSSLDSLGIDYGPVFMSWSSEGFKSYVLPYSAVNFLDGMVNYRLNLSDSLEYGTPIFSGKLDGFAEGGASANIIYLQEENLTKDRDHNLRHELIHTHQYSSGRALGNIMTNSTRPTRVTSENFENHNVLVEHDVADKTLYHMQRFLPGPSYKSPEEQEAYNLTGESR